MNYKLHFLPPVIQASVANLMLMWALAHAAPGDVDLSFDPGSGVSGVITPSVSSVASQPDGKVLIGGNFIIVDAVRRTAVARLNGDGSLDLGFAPADLPVAEVDALVLQPDGKVLVGGSVLSQFGAANSLIRRHNPDGSLDAGFHPNFHMMLPVVAVALQTDGKVLIGGPFTPASGAPQFHVARLNADGTADSTFNVAAGPNQAVQALAVQPDGKVLIGGRFSAVDTVAHSGIARLNPNGSLDTTFNPPVPADNVQCLALDAGGRIYAGGSFLNLTNPLLRPGLVRIQSDGTPDHSFNQQVQVGTVQSVALQPDGKVVIGGLFTNVNGAARARIARLNNDGTLDTGFDPGSGASNPVNAVALDPDGKVLLGGLFTNVNGVARSHVARLVGGDTPVITRQPQSQFVNQGDTVSFSVTAGGNPPPGYQWFKNDTNVLSDEGNLSGTATATLTLTAVQKSDEGLYSMLVSNRVGSVLSSNASLRVNLPPVADASATQLLYISANGADATVTLDGSRSYDPDGDALQFTWYEAGDVLASGMVAMPVLTVGTHLIKLVVSDGMAESTNGITVQVITTAQAVGRLLELCNSEASRPQPLRMTLAVALASIERGNTVAAIYQLIAFEHQVRAQVGPSNPVLAEALNQAARAILTALGRTGP